MCVHVYIYVCTCLCVFMCMFVCVVICIGMCACKNKANGDVSVHMYVQENMVALSLSFAEGLFSTNVLFYFFNDFLKVSSY